MELLYTVSRFSSPEAQEAATKFVNWLATLEAQQIVSDLIALPVKGRSPSRAIRFARKPCRRAADVPVWYDLPETN